MDRGAPLSCRRIDRGRRRLVVWEAGAGEPVLLLESGLRAPSSDWEAVQRELAGTTRVLRYDRAGRGASDPAPGPRDADDLLDDLHAVLRAADVGRCVLAGHSFGGLLARLYAQARPAEVAALALVDAMHEDQFARLGPSLAPPAPAAWRAWWRGRWRDPAANAEHVALEPLLARLRGAGGLGTLPLLVVSAGSFAGGGFGAGGARLQAAWDALQRRLAALSVDVEQLRLPHCSHYLPRAAPQALAEALSRLLRRARPTPR